MVGSTGAAIASIAFPSFPRAVGAGLLASGYSIIAADSSEMREAVTMLPASSSGSK